MRLISWRSVLRTLVLSCIYVGIGVVVFLPEVSIVLRIGGIAIVGVALVELVYFLRYQVRWRISDGSIVAPLPPRSRAVITPERLRSAEFIDAGLYRQLVVALNDGSSVGTRLSIYVASADVRRWIRSTTGNPGAGG